MARKGTLAVISACGIALGLFSLQVARSDPSYSFAGTSAAAGLAFLVAGWALIACGVGFTLVRPASRFGPLLAASGGYLLSFGCMIGIGLAAWSDSGPARAALVLAAIGGAWAIVANLIGVAVVFHRQPFVSLLLSTFVQNRAIAALGVLLQAGLGAVVVLVAAMLLTSSRSVAPASEIAEAG